MFASLLAVSDTITKTCLYEGPAKSFVTGFGLLQCYVLSNIFLLQTFKVKFEITRSAFTETHFLNPFSQSRKADK